MLIDRYWKWKRWGPIPCREWKYVSSIPKGVEKDEKQTLSSLRGAPILHLAYYHFFLVKLHDPVLRFIHNTVEAANHKGKKSWKERYVSSEKEIIIVTIYIFIPEIWWYEIYGTRWYLLKYEVFIVSN